MSNAPVRPDAAGGALSERPAEEVAARLVNLVFERRGNALLREVLIDLGNRLSPHELGAIYRLIAEATT